MFATLLGALPEPTGAGAAIEDMIRAAIEAQETAGLEPITDGRLGDPAFAELEERLVASAADATPIEHDDVLERWRFASTQTDRAVKQALPGPYSIGRRSGKAGEAGTLAVATRLRELVEALVGAGCPLIEIEETEAHQIGGDEGQRALFRNAHRTLADGVAGSHLSLSIVGGSAWGAGLETIADLPYASLALDVIRGSDNWNLATRLPAERGLIVGALPAGNSPADAKEMLLWAARYAAASKGRGLARVGLGSAGSWATLAWEAAVRKIERLGEAAGIAAGGGGENLARELDPRAVNARTAALGEVAPRRSGGPT